MDTYQIIPKEYEVLGELPDPFIFDNGKIIESKSEWQLRRKEIYKTAVEMQYGTIPPKPEFLEFEPLRDTYYDYCPYLVKTGTRENPLTFTMMLIRPLGEGPFPVVVDGDLCFKYPYDKEFISQFVNNGIALALFNRTDFAPDRKASGRNGQLYNAYPEYTFGALGAWAWGYSRCVDVLEQLKFIDKDCIAFTGHSRGGKAAMLAGVLDERAAIVNPNNSGAGSCGCYRVHMLADRTDGKEERNETLKDLSGNISFWMGPEILKYAECEQNLPFDEHFLKALVAPRVLLMTEADDDIWANPIGNFQTSLAAKEVYRFLDAEDNIFLHFRKGIHFHALDDLKTLIAVIKHTKSGEALPDGFGRVPISDIKPIYSWKCPEKKEGE
ncbi:MAG: hypothetical protein IKD04_08870 [Clostridia bacterium]|nr:hypothetical protein [Clostridia bacterium]